MAFENRTELKASAKRSLPGAVPAGPVEPGENVQVTVYIRRKAAEPPIPTTAAIKPHMSHQQIGETHGADQADIDLIERFAHEYQLTVVSASLAKRRVILQGTAEAMMNAFGTKLECYTLPGTSHQFRGRTGTLSLPAELAGVVTAVLGLDNRPAAKPHFRPRQASPTSFTPPQVAQLYNFPSGLTGKGQTVAIIELGGGYKAADLTAYFQSLGTPVPTVTAVSVDGGSNKPGGQADGEVLLDIEVIGAIATGANLAVYFAPNTDAGFLDAVTTTIHDTSNKPSIISISWGAPEDSWTQQSQNAMNAALQDAAAVGVTVTVAAGDNGSSDGVTDGKLHVDFPASSPYVLACGGTTLAGSNGKISSEVVWNEIANNEGATGGGVSALFPIPAYQNSAGVPVQPQTNFAGRGVPDVAGDADPSTGYQVRVDGKNQVIGGTSAVAPLWAALVARMNEKLGTPVGFLNPKLYKLSSSVFHDITSGNNDDSGLGNYSAKPGWDPCTGLGTPNGTALLNALASSASGASGGTHSGTERTPISGDQPNYSASDHWSALSSAETTPVTATVILRRNHPDLGEDLLSGKAPRLTREQAAAVLGAKQEDIQEARKFAAQYGLTVAEDNQSARTLKLQGTARQMQDAFGVQLGWVSDGSGSRYLSHKGHISVPKNLAGKVAAVLGLDLRPIARHRSGAV